MTPFMAMLVGPRAQVPLPEQQEACGAQGSHASICYF